MGSAQFLNITKFAIDLYKDVNGVNPASVQVQEMDLQGVNKLQARKTKWKTVDDTDEKPVQSLTQNENTLQAATLEPQRLRTFEITYNSKHQKLGQVVKKRLKRSH